MRRTIAAWRHALTTTITIGHRLTPDEWAAPTGCPGWSVGDIYAHHLGLETWMRDGNTPPDVPIAKFTQVAVDEWRGRPQGEVLAALEQVFQQRLAVVDGLDPQAPAVTAWGARTTLAVLFQHRVFDVWVHEQDIRWAVAAAAQGPTPATQCGAGPASAVVGTVLRGALPRNVAKGAGAPSGSAVRVSVIGDQGFDLTVRVGVDGRATAGAPVAGEAPDTHVTLGWPEFVRRSAGRDLPDGPVLVSGDLDLGERVVGGLNVAP